MKLYAADGNEYTHNVKNKPTACTSHKQLVQLHINQNTMADQENLQRNNLLKQIHEYQAREEEVRKFLRVLNKDEDSIKADYLDHFNRIMDTFLPNG